MSGRLTAVCLAVAAVSTISAASASATDVSAAKPATDIFCDNGVAPSVIFTLKPNGTPRFTTCDAMVGVVDSQVIVDLGHATTVQVFSSTKDGTTEYTFYGDPQSVVVLPAFKHLTVSVC